MWQVEAYRVFMATCGCIDQAAETLEARLKSIPGGWRDAKMLAKVSTRLFEKLTETIPREQAGKLYRDAKNSRLHITIGRSAIPDPEYSYFPNEAVRVVVNCASEIHCDLCDKSEGEARKCDLRKALNMMTTHDLPQVGGCEYKAMGYCIEKEERT